MVDIFFYVVNTPRSTVPIRGVTVDLECIHRFPSPSIGISFRCFPLFSLVFRCFPLFFVVFRRLLLSPFSIPFYRLPSPSIGLPLFFVVFRRLLLSPFSIPFYRLPSPSIAFHRLLSPSIAFNFLHTCLHTCLQLYSHLPSHLPSIDFDRLCRTSIDTVVQCRALVLVVVCYVRASAMFLKTFTSLLFFLPRLFFSFFAFFPS